MVSPCNDPWTLTQFWIRPESLSERCDWILRQLVTKTAVPPSAYLKVFAVTNLLEAPFYFALLRPRPFWQRGLALIGGNLLTHPTIYFLLPKLFADAGKSYASFLTAAEAFAIAVEAGFIYFLFRPSLSKTLTVIAFANLFSWSVGLLI